MQFISASLGVDCAFCHVPRQFREPTIRGPKKTAREMMAMTAMINKEAFHGRQQITCESCHRGATHPVSTPPVLENGCGAEASYPAGSGGWRQRPNGRSDRRQVHRRGGRRGRDPQSHQPPGKGFGHGQRNGNADRAFHESPEPAPFDFAKSQRRGELHRVRRQRRVDGQHRAHAHARNVAGRIVGHAGIDAEFLIYHCGSRRCSHRCAAGGRRRINGANAK